MQRTKWRLAPIVHWSFGQCRGTEIMQCETLKCVQRRTHLSVSRFKRHSENRQEKWKQIGDRESDRFLFFCCFFCHRCEVDNVLFLFAFPMHPLHNHFTPQPVWKKNYRSMEKCYHTLLSLHCIFVGLWLWSHKFKYKKSHKTQHSERVKVIGLYANILDYFQPIVWILHLYFGLLNQDNNILKSTASKYFQWWHSPNLYINKKAMYLS